MLRKTLLTIAAGAAALAFGASASKADEIFFGDFFPNSAPAGCQAIVGTQEGHVCPNNLTFAGGTAGTLTATGFSGTPGTSTETFLTYKSVPPNAEQEGGLGENTTGPGASPLGCSDAPDCEIGGLASVAITASTALSQVDVLVGSVQAGEDFSVWAGSTLGSLSQVSPVLNNTNCTLVGGSGQLCQFTLATPETIIAVKDETGTGGADILVTAVSTPAVPEPASLALLGSALVGGGWFIRRRRHKTV